MKVRNIKCVITPDGVTVAGDDTFLVEIEDSGGGEYVSICQPPDYKKLNINPNEWPALRKLIDKMVRDCLE